MFLTQAKPLSKTSRWRKMIWRVGGVAVVGSAIALTINRSALRMTRSDHPAGFARGIVQGAMMPLAMPNLLLGDDVPIYAVENDGRMYKLGYTLGVNGCGVLFFGLFFWRLSRWRERKPVPSGLPPAGF